MTRAASPDADKCSDTGGPALGIPFLQGIAGGPTRADQSPGDSRAVGVPRGPARRVPPLRSRSNDVGVGRAEQFSRPPDGIRMRRLSEPTAWRPSPTLSAPWLSTNEAEDAGASPWACVDDPGCKRIRTA